MSKLSSETCKVTGSLWSSCWFWPQCFFTSTCTIWFSCASISRGFSNKSPQADFEPHKSSFFLFRRPECWSWAAGWRSWGEIYSFPRYSWFLATIGFPWLAMPPWEPLLTSHDTFPVSDHLCPNSLFLKASHLPTNAHLGCYASILTWLCLEKPLFSSTFTNTSAEEEKANVCFGGHNSRDSIHAGLFLAPVLPTASCFPFPHQHGILYDLLSWSLNVFWIHQGFSHLAPFHRYPPRVCSCLEWVDQGR